MPFGPVSRALLADLRQEVSRRGLVVWLDRDGHYSTFVDALREVPTAERGFEVLAFRGSHLAWMLEASALPPTVGAPNLVVHLPGFNEESVRPTPLYELYAAGSRYRKALDTLVRTAAAGRVRPDALEAWMARGVTLEDADRWLADADAAPGQGLAAQLAVTPTALLDDLLGGGPVAARLLGPAGSLEVPAVFEHLAVQLGLPDAWRALWEHPSTSAVDVASALLSWAMAVEYANDLRDREPVDPLLAGTRSLPDALIAACRAVATRGRTHHPAAYTRVADETEEVLAVEVRAAAPRDLGRVDTFRFEEATVLTAALDALDDVATDAAFGDALEWAALRLAKGSFWVESRSERRATWKLVEAAAALGMALEAAGTALGPCASLDEAVAVYVARGAAVDRAHRHLEQRRARLWSTQIAAWETVRARLDALRERWRTWADDWARDMGALCLREGFLPSPPLRQRALFEDVIVPFAREPGVTAYFVIDALRYEMATELAASLEGAATTVRLDARLCELPSVTEVGMNALAPVSRGGRLRIDVVDTKIKGFHSGEFRVHDPSTRQRAMQDRVGGASCPWWSVEEVLARDPKSLRQGLAKASLVIVHGQGIDAAGESGFGLSAFADELRKLRTAWELLREAGVKRFVITADHGFLLVDPGTHVFQAHGRRIDPSRRHVLRPDAVDRPNETRVPLAELGMDGTDLQLVMPSSTALFDRGKAVSTFAHGGNSLQERVIPVLTVLHHAPAGGSRLAYAVEVTARDGVAGMHCLEARVVATSQQGLGFAGPREIDLALRSPEAPEVRVELCDVRRSARLEAGAIRAVVGEPFELFFRLHGDTDARVGVEVVPAGRAEVAGATLPVRYEVVRPPVPKGEVAPEPARPSGGLAWLDELPAGGVRELFHHLAVHGSVSETEAMAMLGGARALRAFARAFEGYAARATFAVRIDVVSGVKRYVREGGS